MNNKYYYVTKTEPFTIEWTQTISDNEYYTAVYEYIED